MLQDKSSTELKATSPPNLMCCSPAAAFGGPQEFIDYKTEITN
jgi:hypothetical protein